MKPWQTPTGRAAICLRELYRRHPVGGHLHVITDDGNISDSDFEHVRERHWDDMDNVEKGAWNALRRLSRTARKKAIYTYHQEKWDVS